jgi:hypothetical protein
MDASSDTQRTIQVSEVQPTQPKPTWTQIEIPSKYDIIPIHNSDRATFKQCRRRWNWSSPAKENLTVRADIHGIYPPFFFGTGIHYALEQYYHPLFRHDPVESFKTWWDVQWVGGLIEESWLDKVYDLAPVMEKGPNGHLLYRVRGLRDILPDPNQEEYDELFTLGIRMMERYKEYAPKVDDFEVLVAEHDFSVPIWDYKNNTILKSFDSRHESPNYGEFLEVHARGRMDQIWAKPNGKLGILENKTAEKIGEEYFLKLETDEQVSTYLWAAEIEAQYYDLPHKGQPMEEVVYNVLRKAYPKPPTELRGGMFSVDRNKESTTYEILMEWIKRNIPGVPLSEKQAGYVEWLKEVGDEQFNVRKLVRRNRHQIANAGQRIYLEAMDMLSNPRIYPNIRNDWACMHCQFRNPCMAMESGDDWRQMIKDNYVRAKDR